MNNPIAIRLITTALLGAMTIYMAGCNKPADAIDSAPPSITVGTAIDDSVVTTRVKSALLNDADIKSFDLKVETRKGEVMLSGFVDNQTQINRAMNLIRTVEGVKSIDNKVNVKVGTATVGNKLDDSVITTQVKTALLAEASIKSLDIMVVTRKGEVQLSGFVNNQGQIDRAMEVARGIEGVTQVGNDMSLKK
jgi:hyperosmotically inducible protein